LISGVGVGIKGKFFVLGVGALYGEEGVVVCWGREATSLMA